MTAKVALIGRKKRIFESVFPSTLSTISPIPVSSTSTEHQNSSTSQSSFRELDEDPIGQQSAWDRAWQTVTGFLSIKKSTKIPLQHMFLDRINNDEEFRAKIFPVPDSEVETAMVVVLDPEKHLPLAGSTEDLVAWFTQETRRHFLHVILPHLLRITNEEFMPNENEYAHGELKEQLIVSQSLKTLDGAHRLYLDGLTLIIGVIDTIHPDGYSKPIIAKYRRDLHAVVGNSVSKRLLASLKATLFIKMCVAVGMPERDAHSPWPECENALPRPSRTQRKQARQELLSLVQGLHNVGLGEERFQIIFAELMNECMSDFVDRAFSGVWSDDLVSRVLKGLSESPTNSRQSIRERPGITSSSAEHCQGQVSRSSDATVLPRAINQSSTSPCITELCDWIENVFARLAVEVFDVVENVNISWTNVEKWKEMGVSRLAQLRTTELFDIVCNWPISLPALVDLRSAVTTPQQRLKLTDAFSTALEERLLHPGSTTLQILRTYISMIWSFHALDHSKVLLDRVAFPLQLYLCSREDTVRIILNGLLSDTEDADGNLVQPGGDRLVELAIIMNSGSEHLGQKVADDELDWHDMEWIPDPVDAGPGYKRSKSADIIGTLIGRLGSQEVFIKEFQNMVGENLLKHDGDFEKEIRVLELLKSRFGESPLQSCEVMIKDIIDSRAVDSVIRRKQGLAPTAEELQTLRRMSEEHYAAGIAQPALHAKILSRLFWPQLHDENYRVPTEIRFLQNAYSQGFENLKTSRKLTWLHALGHATVELDLEDRVVHEEVLTWQATVIWAFEGKPVNGESVSRTVPALVEYLGMDESLVRSALSFWSTKLVVFEIRKDEYAVMETLNAEDRERSKNQTATIDEEDGGEAVQGGSVEEKLAAYWPWIKGMLANSRQQMALPQIGMLLRMSVEGGFPHADAELAEFLQVCVGDGKLEVGAGGRYRLRKE